MEDSFLKGKGILHPEKMSSQAKVMCRTDPAYLTKYLDMQAQAISGATANSFKTASLPHPRSRWQSGSTSARPRRKHSPMGRHRPSLWFGRVFAGTLAQTPIRGNCLLIVSTQPSLISGEIYVGQIEPRRQQISAATARMSGTTSRSPMRSYQQSLRSWGYSTTTANPIPPHPSSRCATASRRPWAKAARLKRFTLNC